MIEESVFIDRIRRPAPEGLPIVPISFPVTSFGDVNCARVLTVGLNPSSNEFMTKGNKAVLAEGAKRFVDRESLGSALGEIPTPAEAQRILESNNKYFANGNHYEWFDKMEATVLNPMGYSYFDGTAAHVDVVQWATHPLWSGLDDQMFSDELIAPELDFLRKILTGRTYDYVLFNGKKVYEFFRDYKLFQLDELTVLKTGNGTTRFWTGVTFGSPLLSWSMNVPDHHTSAERRKDLALHLAQNYSRNDFILNKDANRGERIPSAGKATDGHHKCPVCLINNVSGRPEKICGYCVNRTETKAGDRLVLGAMNDDEQVIANIVTQVDPHNKVEHEIYIDGGTVVWIDGRQCSVQIRDFEKYEVVISSDQ